MTIGAEAVSASSPSIWAPVGSAGRRRRIADVTHRLRLWAARPLTGVDAPREQT